MERLLLDSYVESMLKFSCEDKSINIEPLKDEAVLHILIYVMKA